MLVTVTFVVIIIYDSNNVNNNNSKNNNYYLGSKLIKKYCFKIYISYLLQLSRDQ